jgi:hypothetical protein
MPLFCLSWSFLGRADADLVQMAEEVGWVLINAIGAGALEFILAIAS